MVQHVHCADAGAVRQIVARPGDQVGAGDPIVVVTLDGDERTVRSPARGVVASVEVTIGDMLTAGQLVATLEAFG